MPRTPGRSKRAQARRSRRPITTAPSATWPSRLLRSRQRCPAPWKPPTTNWCATGADRQRRLSPEAGGRQPGDEEAGAGQRLQAEGHPSARRRADRSADRPCLSRHRRTELVGCATIKGGFCAVSSPLRLSGKAVDTLSDEETRTLLAHNRKDEKLCGWRP